MNTREIIEKTLEKVLSGLGITSGAITLEYPGDLAHGDYATGAALKYAKAVGKSPRELAEAIVTGLGTIEGVEKIDIAGLGFINFTLTPQAIAASLEQARTHDKWGSNQSGAGKKVMVEYTDPNPFKEFHIGHLMSNAIGESIARLVEFSGAQVVRANYQGDVGLHVAKAIWGYRNLSASQSEGLSEIARWGAAYRYGSAQYETQEDAKSAINTLGQTIFADSASVPEYAQGRTLSLAHFEELYALLGTKFDFYFFESETGPIGLQIVRAHPEVFEESEGAIVFKGEQYSLHTRVFINRLGLPTYEAKELGLAQLKSERAQFDTSITVTAQEQSEYFKVVTKAMELVMGEEAQKVQHIPHGMMRFADGKMSSRTGNVITGESLLNDLTESAQERAAESRATDKTILAQQIAVAAIKYQVLKQGSGKNIVFDRERALSLEGDSGPYLQYAYARTNAIAEKARLESVAPLLDPTVDPIEVTRLLYRFPEVVAYASHELEPHLLTNFLLQLASAFNSWYAQEQILDGTPGAAHKVAVVEAVSRTLKNGLWILGIPAPERM
jgi:arginyl-tRNA synthetase